MTTCLARPLLFARGGGAMARYTVRAYSSLSERLQHELTTRQIPLFYDYLHPQPSHLLNLSLCDLLPKTASTPVHTNTSLPSITNPSPLPLAHHLIYFPPQVTLSQLLPDGTDILHTPGDPFHRRLWAGGNLRFPATSPLLDGRRAVCIESIRNVSVKGREGDEKVIVRIERRMGTVPEGEDEAQTRRRIWTEDEALAGEASVIENRDLIFMRTKSAAELKADQALFGDPGRIVKAPGGATLRHSITPNKSLLFRFSALTFNAHSIHLDKNYTQNEEGYRNLLVHGPLTLTLLLSVLERHFHDLGLRVEHIDYKNLAPLFVDEVLTVCGKPRSGDAWDVWIEGPQGGLAVRGTVRTCGV
ncbi:hypothetical protein PEBR_15754 [Penicillium brasilianum]|uniref:Mesaconyl-C4 CoA hydratase n=1 Tax=Penicillium brasilianum TaxID=104259 RepID=A0A1S9RQ00_PENBI|nr:hypothetical protein PEBR_15754 [Penicillium brasilianum]